MITPTEWKEAQMEQPDMWESILGAVARGWCYEENANKTMDSELSVAIAKEVYALYTTPPPVTESHKRTWVGLTLEERKKIAYNTAEMQVARQIEEKLKEKNT